MFLAYNFEILDEKKFTLSIENRGFLYGDGFFETIFMKEGKVRFLNTHYKRLTNALKDIRISVPKEFTVEKIENTIFNLLATNNITLTSAKIRIHVWRKAGGLYAPISNEFDCMITVFDFDTKIIPLTKQQAGFYTKGFINDSPISQYKSLNASIYTLGGIYMQEQGWNEIIFLTEKKEIVESLYSNIWWIKNNIIFTPSLKTGCIGGVMQQKLFKYFDLHKIEYKIDHFPISDFLEAETVFTSNAGGIIGLKKIEKVTFNTQHPLLLQLQKEFRL